MMEKKEGFRTSLPASGGATVYPPLAAPQATRGDQGRNDKHAHTYERLRK